MELVENTRHATNLKEGDLVQLRTGGPAMSLQSIDADARSGTCMWFDSDGRLQERTFLLTTLRRVTDPT